MERIVIEVSQNRVSAVWSSNPEVKVEILDWDIQDYDQDTKAVAEDDDLYAEHIRGLYLVQPKQSEDQNELR